jgi:hypothetical protein
VEYGEELQTVFDLSLDAAIAMGGLQVERLILREFASLPKAILLEYLREKRGANMNAYFASRFNFAPGSHKEIWAALAPFLLFGALSALLDYFNVSKFVPLWLDIGFVIILWSFGLGLILIGFAKRFPRWFMPYIGIPMPFISILLFNQFMEKWEVVLWYRLPWLLSEFLQQGLLWIGMFFLVILLLLSTKFIPKSRAFHQRLREDWTLLAFLLYGTVPLALVITLNEYKNEELYMFLALLSLAAGVWFYLRSEKPWNRFLYLLGGTGLSIIVVAVAKVLLVESSFPYVGGHVWQIEFMSTIIMGVWLVMIMLIAPVLNLLPRYSDPSAKNAP